MGKLGRTGRTRQSRKKSDNVIGSVFDSNLIVLMQWAKRNGVFFGKVKPANFTGTGRGLKACRKLKNGDCIVSVPEKLLITTRTVERSEVAKLLPMVKDKLSARQLLCLFLLYERFCGKHSFWCPYISTLPDSFSTPCYFDASDLEFLPENYYQLYIEQINTVTKEYHEVKNLLGENSLTYYWLNLDSFKWAWCVVNTRSVYMPSTGCNNCETSLRIQKNCSLCYKQRQEGSYALAPVLDLLNHSDTAEVDAGLCRNYGRYEIHTFTEYRRNSQVFINYGPHDNRTLLIEYGFVLPLNIHTVVSVDQTVVFSVISSDEYDLRTRKIAFIEMHGLNRDFSFSKAFGPSWNLLVSFRVLAMKRYDLTSCQRALGGNIISEENELQVKEWVKILLTKTLGSYRTTVQEDQRVIKQKSCSENRKLVTQLLIQEKLILQETLLRFSETNDILF